MEIVKIDPHQGDLVFGLFDKYRMFYKAESNLDLAKSFIQERLDNKESVIFVALDKTGRPVGFTQLYPSFSSLRTVRNWILNDLYVEEGFRRQGIGEMLMRKAMAFGIAKGAKSIELSTGVNNVKAQKLYEHIGFIRQAPDSDFYSYAIDLDAIA
jgi:ribosomal protein S18 acetylase RimI-like enzyme